MAGGRFGLIKLRNKYIENQSLKVVSDSYRRFLKYTNFFLPIVLVLLIGLYQYREYKKKTVETLSTGSYRLGDYSPNRFIFDTRSRSPRITEILTSGRQSRLWYVALLFIPQDFPLQRRAF